MPGHPVTKSATLMCQHGGTITPQALDTRVQIVDSPVLVAPGNATVAGCGLPKNGPFDQTVVFTTGSTRVTASGRALVLDSVQTPCLASGAPLMAINVQQRVTAT